MAACNRDGGLRAVFGISHLRSVSRRRWCLKMRPAPPAGSFLFTILPSVPRTVLTPCFMSSVNAATPVDQPIHCSHLSIKRSPALTEWTRAKHLFQRRPVASCTYFQFQVSPRTLMETYIMSLPGRPVETLRGHLNF